MSEFDGLTSYTMDDEGNRVEGEFAPALHDEPEPAAPAAGHHPDGSRTWKFVDAADPRSWSDFEYIDNHIDEVKSLGWIEDNVEGYFWTTEGAVEAYELWAKAATENYRAVDFGDGEGVHIDPYVPVADRPQAEAPAHADPYALPENPVDFLESASAAVAASEHVPAAPPAPPAPAGPQWQRPEDRVDPGNPQFGGTNYADVMDELRQRNPENDGRWTASRAAAFEGDTAFSDEQGITAAQAAALQTSEGLIGADGVMTAEAYNRAVDADAGVSSAYAQADSTRNRYQQSTDYQPDTPLDEQQRQIDEQAARAREQAANDPASVGVNMTSDQQQAYAEAQEYAARTGQQIDPQTPLNAEQRAWLEQARESDLAQGQSAQTAWEASQEGQAARAAAERQAEFARTEQERVEASRQGAEERMGRNG
jgi:hypothetical protein